MISNRFSITRRHVILSGGILATTSARSETFPSRPLRVIVPFPAGGGYDVTARLLGEVLSRDIGQPVVVENRSGGSGIVGLEAGWRAAPDGYTLVLSGAAVVTAGPHLRKTLPYEPLGFQHITRLVRMPFILAVRRDLPARTFSDFVELAKRQPLSCAVSGVGSSQHLTSELISQHAGIKLTSVPYRGTTPALNDVTAGVVDTIVADSTALPLIQSGRMRAMAVTSPDRWQLLPDTECTAEVLPGCVAENWYGLAAPPGTPVEVTAFLHARIKKVLADQAIIRRYDEAGLHLALMEPADFAKFLQEDWERWKRVVQNGNIRLEAE